MKKSLVEIYALAVCFVTISCLAIVLGIAMYDIVQIVNPEFTISSHTFQQHESNESFLGMGYNEARKTDLLGKSDSEITEMRKESFARALRGEQRSAFQSLVMNAIILLIDIVLFLTHWILARRARVQIEQC